MADPVLVQTPRPQPQEEFQAPAPLAKPATPPITGLAQQGIGLAAPKQPVLAQAAGPQQGMTSTPPPEAPKMVQSPGPAMGVSVAPPPPVQSDAAAGGAAAGKASAGASAAAGAAGQKAESAGANAMAGASAAAAKPASTPSKTTTSTSAAPAADIGAQAIKIAERILKGDDPIAAQELNSLVMTQGPRNQAMMQSLALRLRQSGLDGQGAGNALMSILASGNEYNNGLLVAKIGERAAQRLQDMTQWGLDKSMQIWEKQEQQKREDLKFMLANGQYGAARGVWDDLYPGVPLDTSAIDAASPVRKEAFTNRMKMVDQAIAQGNADLAKQTMLQLAQEMPEMFGYKDAASAVAAMQSLDFTTEAFLAKGDNIRAVQGTARTAALAGDVTELGNAVAQELTLKGAAAVDAIANAALAKSSLEEINAALEAAGLTPVASLDEARLLPKATLAKAMEMARYASDSRENAVDVLMKDFTRLQPAIALDPAASRAAKAWIAANVYQLASNADGTVSIGSGAEIQPWADGAPTAHFFMDWPAATFGPDGSVQETLYQGLVPYDDQNKPGDTTTPKGQEDARLDKAWWAYVMNTPADKRLSMEEWYYASAAGNRPPDETKIPAGIRQVKPPEPPVEPPAPTDGMPKTIEEERAQMLQTLKPSQQPPDGKWFEDRQQRDYVRGGIPITVRYYWDPVTLKYVENMPADYRILYNEPKAVA